MEKIGILTFHYVDNCGALLQLMGMKLYLVQNGFDVEVLDYRSKDIIQRNALVQSPIFRFKKGWKSGHSLRQKIRLSIRQVFYAIKRNASLPRIIKVHRSFRSFRKKYLSSLSKRIGNITELQNISGDYYSIIVGSDQVWNTELFNYNVDKVYFMDSDNIMCPVIGYAVSAGNTLKLDNIEIARLCKHFHALAARETQLSNQLSMATGSYIETVLDPVFLIPKEKWESLCKENENMNGEYLLLYVLEPNPLLVDTIKQIEANNGKKMKVVELGFRRLYKESVLITEYDPIEFLTWISNAKYIVTNSFHATAFSLIFHKEFYCIKHSTRNNRMETLLNSCNLEKRMIDKVSDVEMNSIDYSSVDQLMKLKVEKSREFLLDALGGKSKNGQV